jgi:hypothetical protein
MKRHLQALGYRWYELPIVLQYNKQDLPDRMLETTLQRHLNPDSSLTCFTSVANKGAGVIETLKGIINLVLVQAQQKI